MSKPFTDIDGKALEALIARVSEATDNCTDRDSDNINQRVTQVSVDSGIG